MTANIYGFAKKLVRFYIVWWIALLWNMWIMFLMSDLLKFDYRLSISVIFIFNISAIFFLQKKLTFENTNKSSNQFYKFTILTFVILLTNYLLIPYIQRYLFNNYSLSFFIISILITIINFVIQNYLIFNPKKYDR